ncbi:response regulator [candidate division KSB1 bacterium]|nr:response regulator [candidate division KSB1 bacterium]
MHILVVDDDDDVRKLVCRMLTEEGYSVAEAANGKEAFQMLRVEAAIVLVITDLFMPEKEGMETIIELKRDYPHIKILAISGGDRTSARNYLEMAKGLGADAVLGKPFMKNDLIKAMRNLLP